MDNKRSPARYYRREAEIYDTRRYSTPSGAYWSKINQSVALSLLPPESIRNHVVADIGCGTGRFSLLFARYAKQVYAIDISDTMLELLEERANAAGLSDKIRTMQSDAASIELEDRSVDIVSCINVFSHLERPQSVVQEVKRILRPKGRFLFNFPNYANLFLPLGLFINHRFRAVIDNVFTHWYTPKEMKALIESADLDISDRRGLLLPMNLPLLSLQKLPIFSKMFRNPLIVKMTSNVFVLAINPSNRWDEQLE